MLARTQVCAVLAALLVPLLVSSVRADSEEYTGLLRDGVNEFAAGNWGEARLMFRRAHEILPTARTFRGLGLCDFELRHYVEAIEEFEASLTDQRRPLTAELRKQVEQTLERARQYVARYALRVPAGTHTIDVDGKPRELPPSGELLLDPGPHTLALPAGDGETVKRSLMAEVGAREELALLPAPRPPPPREYDETPVALTPLEVAPPQPAAAPQPPAQPAGSPRVFTWVAAGLTGVFGAGIVGFALAAQSKHSEYMHQARSGATPDPALKRSGETFETLTNVSIIGCAAAGAAAITLFFVEGHASANDAHSSGLQAGLHPTGAYLRGSF